MISMAGMLIVIGLIFGLIIGLAADGDSKQKNAAAQEKKPAEKK